MMRITIIQSMTIGVVSQSRNLMSIFTVLAYARPKFSMSLTMHLLYHDIFMRNGES